MWQLHVYKYIGIENANILMLLRCLRIVVVCFFIRKRMYVVTDRL